MKMYNKKDLTYKNGMLVAKDGEVIGVDSEIVDLANELETKVQKAAWLETQPETCAGPDYASFCRKHEADAEIDLFSCATPTLDKKAEESLKMMDEIELQQLCDEANHTLVGLTPLIQFVKDDSVVSCEATSVRKFDCPTMGNPLDWTFEDIQKFVSLTYGVKDEEATVEDGPVVEETIAAE